jgi:cobalamin synthase
MVAILLILVTLLLASLIGYIIGFITRIPLLIPSRHRYGRENRAIRRNKSLIFALIGFISAYAIWCALWAKFMYATYEVDNFGCQENCSNKVEGHEADLKHE